LKDTPFCDLIVDITSVQVLFTSKKLDLRAELDDNGGWE